MTGSRRRTHRRQTPEQVGARQLLVAADYVGRSVQTKVKQRRSGQA